MFSPGRAFFVENIRSQPPPGEKKANKKPPARKGAEGIKKDYLGCFMVRLMRFLATSTCITQTVTTSPTFTTSPG